MSNDSKFNLQDAKYSFPYHYVPHFDKFGNVSLSRTLSWGFEYLCYQRHLGEKAISMNPSSVLEVGCGDGAFLGSLPSTIKDRKGVDLSRKAIAFARAFHPECDFRVEDVSEVDGQYDLVAAIEVIEHIPEGMLRKFFQSLSEKVADEGNVIISVPTTVVPMLDKHYRHYTLELLGSQLSDSECGLYIHSHEYIYSAPGWLPLFMRATYTKWYKVEFKWVMNLVWGRIWNKHRYAKDDTGRHLVAYIKKR